MKLGVLFGGNSDEHDISILSAKSVLNNLDTSKYKVIPIYLDQFNNWFLVKEDLNGVEKRPIHLKKINNVISFLQKLDLVFPIMHGRYGEDGAIQGFLELINVPYVGCNILASAVCMNKIIAKNLLSDVCNVTEDIIVKKIDNEYMVYEKDGYIKKANINNIDKLIIERLKYPVFIKPASSGSSVGISKVKSKKELKEAINQAFLVDREILIERNIMGRELECAILNGKAMSIGEVKSADDFYSYSAKYENKSSFTVIPANLTKDIYNNIKDIAQKAFSAIEGTGLARVDFFLEDETNKIYLNEINTMPGFTEISMYPKLVECSKINYKELLDNLINSAIKKDQ